MMGIASGILYRIFQLRKHLLFVAEYDLPIFCLGDEICKYLRSSICFQLSLA